MSKDPCRTTMEENILEEILKNPQALALERALLMLAGLRTEAEQLSYQDKIAQIHAQFRQHCRRHHPPDAGHLPLYRHRSVACCLFQYLWHTKPQRFGSPFQLTEVVDAQLHPNCRQPVGNCLGLTALFSVLALRVGLQPSLLLGAGHVLSRIRVGEETIDIEHTDPEGFDCLTDSGVSEFPIAAIVANVLNNRGLALERAGHFTAAERDYDRAVRINPDYALAFNNRGNMRLRAGDLKGAIADYSEAIRLDPRLCEAHCNRGLAWYRCNRPRRAVADWRQALILDPDYADARRCLETIETEQDRGIPLGPESCRDGAGRRLPPFA